MLSYRARLRVGEGDQPGNQPLIGESSGFARYPNAWISIKANLLDLVQGSAHDGKFYDPVVAACAPAVRKS